VPSVPLDSLAKESRGPVSDLGPTLPDSSSSHGFESLKAFSAHKCPVHGLSGRGRHSGNRKGNIREGVGNEGLGRSILEMGTGEIKTDIGVERYHVCPRKRYLLEVSKQQE